ncbi:tRNA(Ile)-lysidine synthase [Methylacidimicrobium sp. AP8]|uniref:tRNA lysidine(34) synthetase TilS n=1 Tax=Methylacidimicrobium sp. AP8 TaxID=2730359 RepID=UPI0018BFDB60|nr:tRNA lysidine(34) synthetase TilS [Methylacidimicrobium sp. AP8]CAB4244655.1 tRNA(Ile)-lysidine synthase [Methylacidimicrobium sp. AP8]
MNSASLPLPALHATCSAVAELPIRLLAAVSGGLDSCVLLDALVLTGKRPTVVHFDHGWRPESVEDAVFVRELAASYGLEYLEERSAPADAATETSARKRRYEFFARAAQISGVHDLALAHHADDQVETLLLQLLRGAGSLARGMREAEVRDGFRLHRPFLWLDRSRLREHAQARGLRWREDRSNDDRRYLRNRIRHELLPFLEERFSPHVRQSLLRFCRVRIAEEEWMTELVRQAAEGTGLSVGDLRNSPIGRQRRIVHHWLRRQGIRDISLSDVEAVRGLASGGREGRQYSLTGGWQAVRRDGEIRLQHQTLPCASTNT